MFSRSIRLPLLIATCSVLLTNVTRAVDFFDFLPLDEFWAQQQNVEVSASAG